MITALKVRLEPNNKQMSKLFQSAGTARWAYNWTLAKQEENYKNGGKFINDRDLRKELTILKQTRELNWLNTYSNNITKQAIKDACDAYYKFFKGLAEKPKFKSRKKSQPKFYQDTDKIKFKNGKVRLEKIGWIKLSEKNRIPENTKYTNPRVTFDGVHWYVSVGIEIQSESVDLTGESIGIDVGIKYLAVCSQIEKPYKNINKSKKIKRLEKKLRRLQRKVSNKYDKNKKGERYVKTGNIIKLETNIRKLHKRLDNIRTNYRHEVTTEIVKTKPARIVMESLNISGMMKNKHLSKAIQQQGLYEFSRFIQYKAERQGTEFIEADKWYPSSKTCSVCGHVKAKLSLSEREFRCECCGAVIDRDKNASINLSRYEVS
ncbi:IS200/IS605 family transposase ISBth15 [Sporomusa silvacetica DSM 10669]|uniref:IS200/IS605 family transposase ISBth15 n=1 Tax=Sporomusa silvacetica DSM 10669 TaxID=1123289 RepID=A0ABZ3IIT9_9FIRM|nr:RNA-guided endonuclease TnpB family protein [Sporomusa silvacetica]OZC15615.1 putative transposase [Sporomusa silvacetica DSM 10669]